MTKAPGIVRSPQAEALLDELGLEWELREVRLSDIDVKASLANQARLIPLDRERVDRYTRSRTGGAQWPALIAGRNGNGLRLRLADGNHRRAADANVGIESEWVYVFLYTNERQFRAVADLANARLNGAENTPEERLLHAVDAYLKGVKRSDAAALFGVTQDAISARIRYTETITRFEKLGIPSRLYRSLTESQVAQLGPTVTDGAAAAALEAIPAVGAKPVIRACRETRVPTATETEQTQAQLEAISHLVDHARATAAALVAEAPPRAKRDALTMHLRGAIVATQKALAREADGKLNETQTAALVELRSLLCDRGEED